MKAKGLYEVTRGKLITFGIISFFLSPTGIFAFWEASFAFGILSIAGASVQFAEAIASLLLGPHCGRSLAGTTGTSYPSFVMTFVRLLQFGHLNMSIGHGGEGGLPSVMPLMAARRVAWLRKDRQSLNALASLH
ncbi:transmembrane protein 212 [Alca torda]